MSVLLVDVVKCLNGKWFVSTEAAMLDHKGQTEWLLI